MENRALGLYTIRYFLESQFLSNSALCRLFISILDLHQGPRIVDINDIDTNGTEAI